MCWLYKVLVSTPVVGTVAANQRLMRKKTKKAPIGDAIRQLMVGDYMATGSR